VVNLLIFFFISAILTFLIFLVVYLINTQYDVDYEKKSAYKCGFEPFGDARSFFDIQFYVIGLLFVVFDL